MTIAYVGLGSNQSSPLGDSAAQLDAAVQALRATQGLVVEAVSPLYWTEPQGLDGQPWFANRVARLACAAPWTAHALLRRLLEVEAQLGRIRSADAALRFGPRVIDLDLLLFGEDVSEDPVCTLPHPRMMQRAFVLVPLQDVAPEGMLANGTSLQQALARLPYSLQGQRIYQAEGHSKPERL